MNIRLLTPCEATAREDELTALLRDAVEHGASIGFMLPLDEADVRSYWRSVFALVAAGQKLLFAATDANGAVLGTAQLGLEMRANGRHRAEVQKLLVWHRARGRGIGAALVRRVEDEARTRGRSLLFLDTSIGAAGAVEFYTKLGYTPCGGIPDFAANPDGPLVANAIFYKRLA